MPNLRLAIVQTNPTVGDIANNLNRCFEQVAEAASAGANIVLFAEMVVTGYPIEDLATRSAFVIQAQDAVSDFAKRLDAAGLGAVTVVIGHPALAAQPNNWAIAHNRASVLRHGRILHSYDKHHLPNYGVFDEFRNFVPADDLLTFELEGNRISVVICEDIWQTGGPVAQISQRATDLTLVLNGSPFESDKDDRRVSLVSALAQATNSAVAYCNLVGGQDDLVFDGDSLFATANGAIVARGRQFDEDVLLIDFESKNQAALTDSPLNKRSATNLDNRWQIWNAIVTGLRDYVEKNGFKSVVLGLSGGIDSAVCAAIATDALGPLRVFGVSMPSDYSSDHSKSDAHDLADRLGIDIREVAISQGVELFDSQLGLTGLAEENLQARLRGLILMSLSNKEGHLVLTTGNKTELAVGYSTIYGDSVGGFAPIKDVAKTLVWELARWRNEFAISQGQPPPISENSILKPPSAELRPGQLDQDSLPEYDVLDEILELYIEQRVSEADLIARGFEQEVVQRVVHLVSIAEWKRRQGAIGPKISSMSYGRDRRMPITNKFK
jgi:NAD+ synthase (glutamine-hydrolysing)